MDIHPKGLSFPLYLDERGGLEVLDIRDSVRAMIEQILFTAAGERVNRPTFGVGVQHSVFEPNDPFLAQRIRVALEDHIAEHVRPRILVEDIRATSDDAFLWIQIAFRIPGIPDTSNDLEIALPLEVCS